MYASLRNFHAPHFYFPHFIYRGAKGKKPHLVQKRQFQKSLYSAPAKTPQQRPSTMPSGENERHPNWLLCPSAQVLSAFLLAQPERLCF